MVKERQNITFVEEKSQFKDILSMSLPLYLPNADGNFLSHIDELTQQEPPSIPDVIVFDLDSNDREQILEFLDYVKTNKSPFSNIPFITCTVDDDIYLETQLKDLGVYAHIIKPFDIPEFMSIVEHIPRNTS